MLWRATEYYRELKSVTKCYRVLQGVTECYRVLQSVRECYRVLQSVRECYRVLQSVSSAFTLTNFWACFYCNERKRNRLNYLGVKRQINIPLYIFYVGVKLQSSCAECSEAIRPSITLHLLLLGNF